MTTRNQKRKAVEELVSRSLETPIAEINKPETFVADPSESHRIHPENIDEIKTSFRTEIMSDFTKVLAENQKEMLKLIVPVTKKSAIHQNVEVSDSAAENIFSSTTSTPIKSKATTHKNTR